MLKHVYNRLKWAYFDCRIILGTSLHSGLVAKERYQFREMVIYIHRKDTQGLENGVKTKFDSKKNIFFSWEKKNFGGIRTHDDLVTRQS